MNRTLMISGSARKNGDSQKIINHIQCSKKVEVIHLIDYRIAHYSYTEQYENDDFLELMKSLVENYDTFILVTPVYWYAMSGVMKVFFDRITDLLHTHKEVGRQLRGKKMMVISTSNSPQLEAYFWRPFIASADYLGMEYLGNLHTFKGETEPQNWVKFLENLP